jgi:hypothetical protein
MLTYSPRTIETKQPQRHLAMPKPNCSSMTRSCMGASVSTFPCWLAHGCSNHAGLACSNLAHKLNPEVEQHGLTA